MALRILSVAAVITVAAGQLSQLGGPSLVADEVLRVNGGSLNVERRQEISVVEMSTQVGCLFSPGLRFPLLPAAYTRRGSGAIVNVCCGLANCTSNRSTVAP